MALQVSVSLICYSERFHSTNMRTTLRFNCGSIANQELFRFHKNLSALFVASNSTIVIMWSSIKSHRLREKRDGSVQTIGNRSTSIKKLFLSSSIKKTNLLKFDFSRRIFFSFLCFSSTSIIFTIYYLK